jgi:4,5-DOPA dioxygenase extradiol
MAKPRTIHDFYGFPPELFAVEYSAPGAPHIAQEIADLVKPTTVGSTTTAGPSTTTPGQCSPTPSPRPRSPSSNCPSTPSNHPEYHLQLGAALASLRDHGIVIVGSGNVVHNLRRIDPRNPGGYD